MKRKREKRSDTRHEENETADRLHSAAIHLLRRLRIEDTVSGLSGPRLSALSVIVFAGPVTMSALAAAEQVRPPTITRLVREMEAEGLVKRVQGESDRRVQQVEATERGRRLLQEGRERRVARLAEALKSLPLRDRRILSRAAILLEGLALPAGPPRRRQ
jgi:DNA-binding MarR family transcriptional regulator